MRCYGHWRPVDPWFSRAHVNGLHVGQLERATFSTLTLNRKAWYDYCKSSCQYLSFSMLFPR